MRHILAFVLVLAASASCTAVDTISRSIPSQNGFAVDFGKHGPGDVLTLTVTPDSGCQITQAVLNPTPLGWKPGFVLVLGPDAAGTHTGKFGGNYGCAPGVGPPPQWTGTATVDACAERKSDFPVTISLGINSKEVGWLKKIEKWLQKLPLVKKASASISITGSQTTGTECCPGRSDRTDFAEYKADGKGSITFVVHGGPPKLGLPRVEIPIPGTNLAVAFIANVDVGLNGGGTVSLGSSFTGRVGECSCATITASGAAQPQFVVGAKGKTGAELINNTTGDVLDEATGIDFDASATVSLKVTVNVTTKIGKNCGDDLIQACVTWPTLVLSFSINVFTFVNINYPLDVTKLVYGPLGIKETICYPE